MELEWDWTYSDMETELADTLGEQQVMGEGASHLHDPNDGRVNLEQGGTQRHYSTAKRKGQPALTWYCLS